MQPTNGGLIYVTWGSSEELTIAGLLVRPPRVEDTSEE
jgi:hypothetical protein